MHRPSGCAIAFGYISLRVQDVTGRSIATRCIAMLYRATRPRELPSVNQVHNRHIAHQVAMPLLVLSDAAGQALKELGSARQTGRAPVSV
jgi:hypothetical protein